MAGIFNRLVNLARTELNHLTDKDRKVSEEFSNFFKERLKREEYDDFFYSQSSQGHDYQSHSYSEQQSQQRKYQKQSSYSSNQGYDPYKTLEVSSDASPEEIEKAYRKMARKYHPDRFQTAQEREDATRVMSIINASYEFLKKQR